MCKKTRNIAISYDEKSISIYRTVSAIGVTKGAGAGGLPRVTPSRGSDTE